MSEQLINWLIVAITSLTTVIVFLYRTNSLTQEKLKQEHQATLNALMSKIEADRVICETENKALKEAISKLNDQFLQIAKEHGKLSGRLEEMTKEGNRV